VKAKEIEKTTTKRTNIYLSFSLSVSLSITCCTICMAPELVFTVAVREKQNGNKSTTSKP